MSKPQLIRWVAIVASLLAMNGFAQPPPGTTVEHDPWLNWDVINITGLFADDFHIVVESDTFNPNPLDMNQVMLDPSLNTFSTSVADYDGDQDNDTIVSWSGLPNVIIPNGRIHIGLAMAGAGDILAAYWTAAGLPIGPPIPVVNEKTRVFTPDPAGPEPGLPQITMRLTMPPEVFGGTEIPGLTGIRTFINLPASQLGLPDINADLDLATLALYEVQPRLGGPTGPPILPGTILWYDNVQSFFDVFLDETAFTGSAFESLLYAQVVMGDGVNPPQNPPYVLFWNLNPQCPEPASLLTLALASVVLIRRRCH